MSWDKSKFYSFIIENNVIGFFEKPLKLKSGRSSYWYVNWRNITEETYLIDELTDYLIDFVNSLELKPDCFYGVPEGATKLGIITQFKWAKIQSDYGQIVYKLSMGRAKPKEHGDPKDKYFLGIPSGKVIILEDVTTTGGSLLQTINSLKDIGVKIIAAIGLTNRNELRDDGKSVEQIILDRNVKYFSMSNAIELLPIIYNKLKPGEIIAKNIENYFKKYGIDEIKLL